MNVSAAGANLGNVDLGSKISVAVARKTLDAAEASGQAAVDMIRQAGDAGQRALRVTPRPDLSAGRGAISARPTAAETGGRLDVTG